MDVLYKNATPILNTTGPYVYQYHWYNFDVEWSDDGKSQLLHCYVHVGEFISYFQFENYIYDAEASNGSNPYTDIVCFLNIITSKVM